MTAAAKKRSVFDSYIEREPTAIAHREGFTACQIGVLESLWNRIEAEEGSAEEWFSRLFETLRRTLLESMGERGADAFRRRVVYGEPRARRLDPPAGFAFLTQARAGRRGISDDGMSAAINVPRRDRTKALVILQAWPQPEGSVRLILTPYGFVP